MFDMILAVNFLEQNTVA